jgi:uncharacterized protein YjiS (DUF1127 family)
MVLILDVPCSWLRRAPTANAAAIQPLFNAFCQKIGQMLIARHAVSCFHHTDCKTSTDCGKRHADTVLADLYVKQKLFLICIAQADFHDDNPTGTARRTSWNFENRSKRPFIVFVWMWKTVKNWYRINRTRRILSRMSDEQLKDVGLSRFDVYRRPGQAHRHPAIFSATVQVSAVSAFPANSALPDTSARCYSPSPVRSVCPTHDTTRKAHSPEAAVVASSVPLRSLLPLDKNATMCIPPSFCSVKNRSPYTSCKAAIIQSRRV